MPSNAPAKTRRPPSGARPDPSGRSGREYAEPRFSGQRNRQPEEAEADLAESARGPIVTADTPAAGNAAAIVMESSLGGQPKLRTGPTPGGSRRGAGVWGPPTWTEHGGEGGSREAVWDYGSGGRGRSGMVQDQVLADPALVEQVRHDPGAVAPEDMITRREPGPALPTGEPCSCAWVVEQDPATGEISVLPGNGISTSFRGAPSWVAHCIVCGGMRDGSFDPEYAERYGRPVGPPPPAAVLSPADVDRMIADRLARSPRGRPPKSVDKDAIVAEVSEAVMGRLADVLSSDSFLSALADRMKVATTDL